MGYDELAREIAAGSGAPKDWVLRAIRRGDRLLERVEKLNLALTPEDRLCVTGGFPLPQERDAALVADVLAYCQEVGIATEAPETTAQALDLIFAAQEVLFALRVPVGLRDAGEGPDRPIEQAG